MLRHLRSSTLALTTLIATSLPVTTSAAATNRTGRATSRASIEQSVDAFRVDQTATMLLGLPVKESETIEEHLERLPEAVRAEMTRWLTDNRSTLIDGYRRFKFLEHVIGPAYDTLGLPRELAAGVTLTESAVRTTARSHRGAEGLWQLMPRTARHFGLRENEVRDPVAATRAHAAYFRQLLERYDQDVLLALAAYNAGPRSVDRFLRQARATTFWEARSRMYRETSLYSPRALAVVELLVNARFYNFAPFDDEVRVSTVVLPRPYHLDEAGICLGENIWNLENLNPLAEGRRLDKGDPFVFPSRYESRIRDCLEGEEGRIAALLSAARNPDEVRFVVQLGDTVSSIARRYNTTVEAIVKRNRINPNRIRAGQALYIPQR